MRRSFHLQIVAAKSNSTSHVPTPNSKELDTQQAPISGASNPVNPASKTVDRMMVPVRAHVKIQAI